MFKKIFKDKENPDAKCKILESVSENKKILQNKFHNSIDVVFYEFETLSGIKSLIVYISNIIKRDELDRDILNPFISQSNLGEFKKTTLTANEIKKFIPVANIKEASDINTAISAILNGSFCLFIEDITTGFILPFDGWQKRSIEEPQAEAIIRGPKEGFIESLDINRTLIRRIIKSENLVFEEMKIGKQTKTTINIVYLDNIVSLEILAEVRKRLAKIEIDAILDSAYLEEYIEDSHISPIATVGNTQKPDIVVAKILEGRVAIMCDGSPHVLTVPYLFVETLQTSEDYYMRPYVATLLRVMRLVAFAISVLLPAFYVALETYHQEMLPTVLFITMAGANKGTPFPSFLEALLMITAFEFLKESGTRMPKAIGSAISIVGALVLGDAAVKAGIVSADLIAVVALTAVSTFIIPALNDVITLYRLVLLVFAALVGIYGITAGVFIMLIHATSIRSFGVPYMSPIAPLNTDGIKDFIIRFSLRSMKKRPAFISKRNSNRR
jgi:spore germination protein KA